MIKTNKEKTLNVADRQIPVNFSINYFFKFFLDKTGIDLLSEAKVDINEKNTYQVFDYLSSLLFAGNNAYQKLHKKGEPLSAEETQDVVYTLGPAQALALLNECVEVLKGDEKNVTSQAGRKKTR